jgi:hypothetical protein
MLVGVGRLYQAPMIMTYVPNDVFRSSHVYDPSGGCLPRLNGISDSLHRHP